MRLLDSTKTLLTNGAVGVSIGKPAIAGQGDVSPATSRLNVPTASALAAMPNSDQPPDSAASGNSPFVQTHWSLVLAAAGKTSRDADEALGELCKTYWYPLYAYVRRKGHDAEEAKDLTQEFFAGLLKRPFLQDVHPEKGRFRSYLLACLNHFLFKDWRRLKAEKRGGNLELFSLDAVSAEGRYLIELSHDETPETLYDRQWAQTLLARALAVTRARFATKGDAALFDSLQFTLTGGKTDERYAAIAERLGKSATAIKSAVARLREEYRDAVRAEIARTVRGPSEIDAELQHLFAVLRGQ